MIEVVNRVKKKRINYGVSQNKLAVISGISRQYLNDIENGKVIPSEKMEESLLLALERFDPDCPLEMLFDYVRIRFDISSHKLRHNFATNYCLDQYKEHGQVDIYRLMVLMGHEEISTTRRYLHMANQIIATQTSISHIDQVLR